VIGEVVAQGSQRLGREGVEAVVGLGTQWLSA
jgi:hypothetical protein